MTLTEDPESALFLPVLRAPISETWLIVRPNRGPRQLAQHMRRLRSVDRELPFYIETCNQQLEFALFPSRMSSVSLGVLGGMGAIRLLSGIFGMAAYSVSKRLRDLGMRVDLGSAEEGSAGGSFG